MSMTSWLVILADSCWLHVVDKKEKQNCQNGLPSHEPLTFA